MASQRHNMHAAGGKGYIKRVPVERPDTVVYTPDGATLTLSRSKTPDTIPVFEKYNPGKIDPKTGRLLRQAAPSRARFSRPSIIPFGKLVLAAVVVHKLFAFLKKKLTQKQQRKAGDAEQDDDDEEGDEEQELPHVDLVPAMLRGAMPKPKHVGLAHRAANLHHNRPRDHKTARQKLHPSNVPTRRPTSKLEKMHNAVEKQLAVLGVAPQAPTSGPLGLPAPAPAAATGQTSTSGRLQMLPPPQQQQQPHKWLGPKAAVSPEDEAQQQRIRQKSQELIRMLKEAPQQQPSQVQHQQERAPGQQPQQEH